MAYNLPYASVKERCETLIMQYLKLQSFIAPTRENKADIGMVKTKLKKLYIYEELPDYLVEQLKQIGLVKENGEFVDFRKEKG